jgi:hypothetical protein
MKAGETEPPFQEISLEEAMRHVDLDPLPDGVFGIPHFLLRVFGENIEVTNRRDGSVSTSEFFELNYEGKTYRFSARQGQLVVQVLAQVLEFRPIE